uniref:TctD transcriptional regulator n=1 Tax=Sarcopeltis skottsbergii TaxID=2765380 RepID=A0A7M1VIH2_SARSK|nr:hypothetical protein [Sarcopeltis skottsbergii]
MKRKLLLVDDDICLRHSISSYLQSEGFLVDSCHDVSIALLNIKDNKPDLIIADIMMPELDGYTFITKLKEDEKLCSIPVIFLTAKGMTNDRIKAYNLGCNAYISKPFDPQELLSIICSIFTNISLLQKYTVKKNDKVSNKKLSVISFTNRETTILQLVIKGLRNKEIAACLNISIKNVEKYVSRLLNKTSTKNRTELAQFILSKEMEVN